MRRWAPLLSIIFLIALQAQSPDNLFTEAQQLYDEGEYSRAVDLYRQILKQGKESSRVHYNLGNAYFRVGELGEAILHWEKAKELNPRDQDIRFNLRVGRARIQDRIDAPEPSFLIRIFNGIKYWLTLDELGWSVGGIFLLGSLSFAVWRLVRKPLLVGLAGIVLGMSVLALLLAGPLLVSRLLENANEEYGIVLVEEIKARSGPQEFSTGIFILHEGTRVEVEEQRRQWYQIQLVDGKEGWIPASALGVI